VKVATLLPSRDAKILGVISPKNNNKNVIKTVWKRKAMMSAFPKLIS